MPDRAPIQPLGRRTTYHQNLRCADAIWDFCGFLAQVMRSFAERHRRIPTGSKSTVDGRHS